MKPFVKWAGGKRQILEHIEKYLDDSKEGSDEGYTYIEPFVGGGAVFLNGKYKKAIINDLNEDLINAYRVIQSEQYLDLINLLKQYSKEYKETDEKEEYYYDKRALDRNSEWLKNATNVERAARMIFLNKTCYNGLYRVNSKGQFNTPIGRYKNPLICDEDNLKEIHDFLSDKNNDITIMCGSYEDAMEKAGDGDIIYLDPPYDYEDDDGFTKYQMQGFTFDDFVKLKHTCDDCIKKGAKIVLSNNATTKVCNLFLEDTRYKMYYDENRLTTLRYINCNGAFRKTGKEIIIFGMNCTFPQANDINKVIKLAQIEQEKIEDKEYIKNLIDVSTDRQVAYYLSALVYLGYLKYDRTFTEKLLELRTNECDLKNSIYNTLLEDPIFGNAFHNYNDEFKNRENIEKFLRTAKGYKMSESTIRRRASTVVKWVEWMYSYKNKA